MTGHGLRVGLREHVWEIPLRRYLALLLCGALAAGLTWAVRTVTEEDRSCGEGVVTPEGSTECVGVTSSHTFGHRGLRPVVAAIAQENARVVERQKEGKGEYVTVALLEPYTASDRDTVAHVLRQLQGSYLAQYRANHSAHGQTPAVRLVLASPGKTGTHWKHTVDELVRLADGPDRLRAVTGIGQSTRNNTKAVRALTRHHIPVVGSSITADALANAKKGDGETFPGLARVAPSNTDQARALAHYAEVEPDEALLVYDRPGDPYTRTLQKSFEKLMKGSRYPPQPYTSAADPNDEGTTPNTFQRIKTLVCDTPDSVDTIFFAGRHTQLRQFVNALGERGCQDRALTLLTGDEGSYLAGDKDLEPTALRRNLTVRYTALAHPEAWRKDTPATGGSARDFAVLADLVEQTGREGGDGPGPVGPVSLEDGQVIIAYDAMQLAVHGVRAASPDGRVPSPREVGLQWSTVKGGLKVQGASGWICLDVYGNPYNKAVPIVQLTRDAEPRFVRNAWPEGDRPPGRECLPSA